MFSVLIINSSATTSTFGAVGRVSYDRGGGGWRALIKLCFCCNVRLTVQLLCVSLLSMDVMPECPSPRSDASCPVREASGGFVLSTSFTMLHLHVWPGGRETRGLCASH